jgi:hypothetical protein
MQKKSDDFSLQEAMRLANSPAGQQILAMLRQNNPHQLQQAMGQAASGNYTQAQYTLKSLLQDPQLQTLLRQLQEGNHG